MVRPALADCATPEPELLWSQPAQGDTDVPTNADLWLMDSGWWEPPRVSLDGVALTPLDLPFGYDLGELEPHTTYSLSVEPNPDHDPGTPSAPFALSFTTGAGPSSSDAAAAPMAVTTSRTRGDSLSPLCQALLDTQDCFDTGQDTHFHFAPSGSARAWLVRSSSIFRGATLWPAECGDPRIFSSSYAEPCATLIGIDAVGATHAGDEVCMMALSPEQEPSRGGSGTQTASAPGAPSLSNPAAAQPGTDAAAPRATRSVGCAVSAPSALRVSPLGLLTLLGLVALGRCRKRR